MPTPYVRDVDAYPYSDSVFYCVEPYGFGQFNFSDSEQDAEFSRGFGDPITRMMSEDSNIGTIYSVTT